ncbi:MAG: hypothetical protein K1X89_17365 [Myxococcaceae bacterium]|nr:hypothetical protein [Myxococcaceae bacterium]
MSSSAGRTKGPLAHRIRSETRAVKDITPALRDEMFALFQRYFETDRKVFDADLDEKSHAFLVFDSETGAVVGFSTIMPYPITIDGRTYRALHGGDSIIDAPYWGQKGLDLEYVKFMVRTKLRAPLEPLYWFNMTQGYKTYLKIAHLFPSHWPRYDAPTPPLEQALMHAYATKKFGSAYKADRGLVIFDHGGKLKEDVAPITPEMLQHPEIAFFVQKNPNHAAGDELLGIAKFDLHMVRAAFRRIFR